LSLLERPKEGIFAELLLSCLTESSVTLLESLSVVSDFGGTGCVHFETTSVHDDGHGAVAWALVGTVSSAYDLILAVHDSALVLTAFNSIVDEQGQGSLGASSGTVRDALCCSVNNLTIAGGSRSEITAVSSCVTNLTALAHVKAVVTSGGSEAIRPGESSTG
jgi:hypothetical protein